MHILLKKYMIYLMASNLTCSYCNNQVATGKIQEGKIICSTCEYKVGTCFKCKKKTFVDKKCTECKFEYTQIKCQLCDKFTSSGTLFANIFLCDPCKVDDDGKNNGCSKCPTCNKHGLKVTDDTGYPEGGGMRYVKSHCKLCYHSSQSAYNSWDL